VKFHKHSLGRSRHIYTGGRKDERTERFEEYDGRLQNSFAKAPKHASSRNNVERYALTSADSLRGRVGLQARQKVSRFLCQLIDI